MVDDKLKFLCSYGGKILPRYPDGKLRYNGGHTRLLSLPRSIPFSELIGKLGELCGSPVTHLRCQLPTEDLDALVSITSDDDLANLVEEYDRVSSPKIRAFLSSSALSRTTSSSSSSSSSSSPSSSSSSSMTSSFREPVYAAKPPVSIGMKKSGVTGTGRKVVAAFPCYGYRVPGNGRVVYVVNNGNHWQ